MLVGSEHMTSLSLKSLSFSPKSPNHLMTPFTCVTWLALRNFLAIRTVTRWPDYVKLVSCVSHRLSVLKIGWHCDGRTLLQQLDYLVDQNHTIMVLGLKEQLSQKTKCLFYILLWKAKERKWKFELVPRQNQCPMPL